MSTKLTNELKHESLQLLQQYRQSEDSELRNQVLEINFGLVRREAHHWVNQCNESYEDLLQVGCLGLLRAIEKFDVTRGNAFSTFAIPYIRGEIRHYLRDKGCSVKIPRRWLELRQQAAGVTRRLQEELHRQPTDADIAEALKVSPQEWQEIKLAYKNHRQPLSLDVLTGENDERTSLGELVPDLKYRSFQLAEEDRLRLQQALVHLEHRTRDIVEFVFFHELTHKEVAERLGISVVTVSRQVKKGLNSLKNLMLVEI